MIDEQKLRELIAEATPGPWFVVGQPWNPKADFIVAGSPDPHMGRYVADTEDFDGEGQNVQENAAWIAAANPATISALLDELQSLRSERTAWRVTAENAEAAVKQARIDALEEARKLCDELAGFLIGHQDRMGANLIVSVRDSIESLKGKTP